MLAELRAGGVLLLLEPLDEDAHRHQRLGATGPARELVREAADHRSLKLPVLKSPERVLQRLERPDHRLGHLAREQRREELEQVAELLPLLPQVVERLVGARVVDGAAHPHHLSVDAVDALGCHLANGGYRLGPIVHGEGGEAVEELCPVAQYGARAGGTQCVLHRASLRTVPFLEDLAQEAEIISVILWHAGHELVELEWVAVGFASGPVALGDPLDLASEMREPIRL